MIYNFATVCTNKMDRSKEEMQKRLTELKKELARKQRKLERSRRLANVRAHVRQKVNELKEKEQQAYMQEDEHLEENIPLPLPFPSGGGKFSTDLCQLMPTGLVSKVNADNMPVLSTTDTRLNTNITINELITETAAQSNLKPHAVSDISIKGKEFTTNAMINKKATSVISNNPEIKMCTFESKNNQTKDINQVKTSSNFKKRKQEKLESVIPLSNRIGSIACDPSEKSVDKAEAESKQSEKVITRKTSTEEAYVETNQCPTDLNRKNKILSNNNKLVEKSTAWFSDFSTASKKTENEEKKLLLFHTSRISDLEFLQILGVSQTKSVETSHQTNANILTKSLQGEESTLVMSSSSPTSEHITNPTVQPSVDKVSPTPKDQPFFLDYTELDAIPFTKFELEEDFLSEVSQNTQPYGSCPKHQVGNSFKVGPLIKRRSPRLSEINQHSPLTSSQNKQHFAARSKRRLSEQEKVVAIRSIFQFLKEEAVKPKWSSDFDNSGEFFQNLQNFKQINTSALVSTNEIKHADISSEIFNDFELNVCESLTQSFKNSLEPVSNISDSWDSKNTFVNYEAENHKAFLVLDKEINCSKQFDNTVTNNSLLQNHTQLPSHLSLVNERNTKHSNVFTSPPSPIPLVMTEEKNSLHETPTHVDHSKTDNVLKASNLGSVLGNINPSSNQDGSDLKSACPLLTTSTPKAVKTQSFPPKMTLDDTLDKSAILFEENQQDNPVTPPGPRTNLLEKSCNSPDFENNLSWNGQITCSHHIDNSKRDSSLSICSSPNLSKTHVPHMTSVGYSPIQLIKPWKKLERTPQTPLRILEDKRNENDQSPLVYIPARRLSRSQLSETESKTLKFSGCFQSCCQDAVINILCGSLLTQHKNWAQYLVSVQATCLTIWTKDDHLEWTTELEWRLPPENHLIQAQLLPVTDKIVIITCGWDGGYLFVSLFLYESESEDTKRYNIQVSELSSAVRSPTNATLETVSKTEILLGVTNDTVHILGKIDFSADLSKEQTTCFIKQQGQLLGLITVTGQETTCISLSSSQNITIWNTSYGIAIKSINLPVHVPCLIQLLKAKNYQGTILLEALWKVEQGCGGLLIINPLNNKIKMLKTYCVPNSTWKSTQSAKIEMGLVAAISNTGSFCLWQSKTGKLVCHSKSHTTTALSVNKSDQSLLVGEIQGCLHLYKLTL